MSDSPGECWYWEKNKPVRNCCGIVWKFCFRLDDNTICDTIDCMDEGLPKWTILIPLAYNDGSKVPRDILDQILDEIFVVSSGFQIGEPITGAYKMSDGSKIVEKMLPISLGMLEVNVPDLEKMAAKFAAVLHQESLYLERTGGTMYFIRPVSS